MWTHIPTHNKTKFKRLCGSIHLSSIMVSAVLHFHKLFIVKVLKLCLFDHLQCLTLICISVITYKGWHCFVGHLFRDNWFGDMTQHISHCSIIHWVTLVCKEIFMYGWSLEYLYNTHLLVILSRSRSLYKKILVLPYFFF